MKLPVLRFSLILWIRFRIFILYPVLLPAPASSQTIPKPNVIAYYTGHYKTIGNYDLKNITHIIFGFGRQTGNKLTVAGKNDSATIQNLVSLRKQYPQLKIILAFGGWGGCKTCSEVFSTQNGRSLFASSAHGKFTKFILYKKLKPMLNKTSGFKSFYDSAAEAAYGFNPQRKECVSFQDFKSVKAKAGYVLSHRLNGIMFWELSQDYISKGFLNVITKEFHNN